MRLAQAISERTVVLDGGLATLLEARGHDLSSELWSARLLNDDPEAIRSAHLEFFAAGAEVATTASYQASFQGYASLGLDADAATALMTLSVELAREARDEHGAGWVAASIGPYGAVLADGSEYRGDYGLTVPQLRDFHRRRLDTLADASPDVFAIETIPCLAEVEAMLAEIDGTGSPAWLSLTTGDGHHTRNGEPLAEAFAMAADVSEIVAVGVNCLAPAHVADALAEANAANQVRLAYPNSGQGWDAGARAWTGELAFDPDAVTAWQTLGARLIGGCCRVGPAEIAAVAAQVGAAR